MSWVNLDDKMPDHPKISRLSDASFRLHIAGVCYCNRHLSDGLIDAEEVPRLVRRFKPAALAELVDGGLWVRLEVGKSVAVYAIHDFLDWNDPREEVLARRERAKQRAAKSRGATA